MHPVDIVIVIAFLVLMLWLGLRQKSSENSGEQYLLGGRLLTLPAFIATTVSTWYGGILGVGEYTYLYGISNWLVFGVPYYVGAILFALLLSKRARKGESLTIPHRFENHYGKGAGRLAAVLIFLTTIPGAYMLIMGILSAEVFGIGEAAGIVASAVFVVVYLWRGGFKAVVRTDALQIVLMFGGFVALSTILLVNYGLSPLEQLPPTHLSATGGLPIGSVLVWYVIALSTLAEPNFFQRCFAAKTPEIARNGLLISVLCWLCFDAMTTFCGLYARVLLPDLSNPLYAFPKLAKQVLPLGLTGIFFTGMFATVLSTLDSNLFTTATTFGHDLWPQTDDARMKSRTRIGLIVGAIAASCIALASGSVVKIWKLFGSISAASLMIPILSTYYPRMKLSGKGAVMVMIAGSLTTIIWHISAQIMGHNPLDLEPLFAGLIISVICYAGDRLVVQISRKPI